MNSLQDYNWSASTRIIFGLMFTFLTSSFVDGQVLGLRQTDQDYIHFGDEQLYYQDFEKAIIDYTMALEINPRNAEAYIKRARVYAGMNRNREAYQDIRTALDINPLAELYVHPDHRRSILKSKKYGFESDTDADKPFGRSLILDKEYLRHIDSSGLNVSESFLFESALLAIMDKEYEAAMHFINKWYQNDNKPAMLYDLHGLVLLLNGNPTESISLFTKAMTLNENYVLAHYNRAMAYKAIDRPVLAEQDFLNALDINDNLAKIHFGKASVLSQLGEKDNAMQQLQKAIDDNPGYEEAIGNYAILLKQEGYYDDALLKMDISMQSGNSRIENHYIRGSLSFIVGNYKKAIDDFKLYLSQFPDDQDALFNLVIAEMLDGQVDQACTDSRKIRDIQNQDYLKLIKQMCY